MKVRVMTKCYFGDRVCKPGKVVELKKEDMNTGKDGKPTLPSWAEMVDPKAEEKESGNEEKPEPDTLHEMAERKPSKVSKPAKKSK